MSHPSPPDRPDAIEARRIARLRALMVLDSESEPIFDTLTTLASQVCQTPIALLSLVDAGRQWFKANVGLPHVSETPRSVAFCDHAIRGKGLMEVPDARLDARFMANPLVNGPPDIRFYAGAPLVMGSGERIGTLCVIDRETRNLSPEQARTLEHLARLAVQALEMRERSVQQSLAVRSEREHALAQSEARLRAILDAQSELVSQAMPDGHLVYVNPAYASFFGQSVAEITGTNLLDFVRDEDRSLVQERIDWVLATGRPMTSENRMLSANGDERWVSWTNNRQFREDGEALLHSTGRDVTARVRAQRALAHSEALLERTGKVAGIGGGELDIATRQVSWTEETRRIHEVAAGYRPTLEGALDFYSPESRPIIQRAVQSGLEEGKPWDLELQLITAKGRTIWARAVGEIEFEGGRPVRMFGAFQDITERRAAEQARQEIAAIFENTTDYVIQADRQRRVRYMNPAAALAMLGRAWDGGKELFVRELLPESTQKKFAEEILPALQAHNVWVGQSLAYLADRREIPVSHMVIAHRDATGGIERYSVIFRDISQLVSAQLATERQANTLRSVANAIPSTVAVVSSEGRYVFVNEAFERMARLPSQEILGRNAREILGEREFDRRWPFIQKALAGEPARFEVLDEGTAGQKNIAIDYLPLRTPAGEPDGFVVVGQDITEAKQEQQRLQAMSQTDPLTGLLNRAGFEQRLRNQLDRQADEPLTILYVDLDHFKPVNDTHGHATGDELLRLVAKRLMRLVRPNDPVARLGGDEFAVVLLGMGDREQAERVAQSVVDAVCRPFKIKDALTVAIGASVGGAVGAASQQSWPDMLARADQMLYAAKSQGRNRIAVAA